MTTELHRLIWDVLEIMTRSESVDLRYLKYIYLGPGNYCCLFVSKDLCFPCFILSEKKIICVQKIWITELHKYPSILWR